ncbi:PepSY domain-containing protein [Nocardia sp. KC 131]|uniref:PepSY domain-containing protein n=1 Tax=Nocardia arseniciresistens TaxID=3392119 RepID=UPI00398E447C
MDLILRRALAGLRWLLVGAAVATIVVGGVVAATGTGRQDLPAVASVSPSHDWTLTAATTINRQQAIDKALEAVPGGVVVSAELDIDRGTTVWEVELRAPDGIEYDVTIDANSGAVIGENQD